MDQFNTERFLVDSAAQERWDWGTVVSPRW